MALTRRSLALVSVIALVASGCASSGDTDSGTTPPITTSLTTDECLEAARSAVIPLQEFIDQYGVLTAAEWNVLDPVPDIVSLQDDLVSDLQATVDAGCVAGLVDLVVADELAQLTGTGEVGLTLAAALRGEGTPLGPQSPAVATTAPRDELPTTVEVEPGDDLMAILATIAPGSRLELAAGVFEFDDPVVIDAGVEIVGAGRDETFIRSTAADNAVVFLGPGRLTIRGLTLEHVGQTPASVLASIVGSLVVVDVRITGGRLNEDGESGGQGIVLAFGPIEGIPDRTAEQLAGDIRVEGSEVTANAGGGILITGEASPRIERTAVNENGRCGLCYAGSSAGLVTASRVERNDIGLQITGTASPVIDGNEVVANRTAGAIIVGEASPTMRRNKFTDNLEVSVQVLDSAVPVIDGNTIIGSGTVGISFADDSAGEAVGNTLRGHQVGVQVTGTARPDILGNIIEDSVDTGALYAGTAAGRFEANTVSGSASFGVQIGETASPAVVGNVFTTIEVASILFVDTSTGELSGNDCSGGAGIGIAPTASPNVGTNDCLVADTG